MSGVAAFVVCGGYIEILGSYCVRFEPVVSESCSLKSLVHIYLRLLPIPSLLATMDGG